MMYPAYQIGEHLAVVINTEDQEVGIVEIVEDEDQEASGVILTVDELGLLLGVLQVFLVNGKLVNQEGPHVH
jgi:hypothetical protein